MLHLQEIRLVVRGLRVFSNAFRLHEREVLRLEEGSLKGTPFEDHDQQLLLHPMLTVLQLAVQKQEDLKNADRYERIRSQGRLRPAGELLLSISRSELHPAALRLLLAQRHFPR